jgi:colanic acid/amylovoran biosynthesis glycosyltransferase
MASALRNITVCIIHEGSAKVTAPFIRAHIDRLPCRTVLVHGVIPSIADRPLLAQHLTGRALRSIGRRARGLSWDREITDAYIKAIRDSEADVVLAEWGTVAARLVDATLTTGVPLVAHFHGYEVGVHSVLAKHADAYRKLFAHAAAIVSVSRAMTGKLITLGAPPDKVHYNTYGTSCEDFGGGDPGSAPPEFVAVGRFVEKKAPHVTILAFASVLRLCPEARLRMIGKGPLLDACRQLTRALNITHAVEFLGPGDIAAVQAAMRRARCFVLHSVEAPDGDTEGTPNVVLEAGATGLPVVSTRHAGIPDVVVDGETGLLVDEYAVDEMADRMLRLAQDAGLAGRMGASARRHIEAHYTEEHSIAGLWDIIQRVLHANRATRRSQA